MSEYSIHSADPVVDDAPGVHPRPDTRRPAWWMLLLLAALAAGVYINSLKNGFAYDDVGVIKDNPHVADLQWTRIWVDNYWTSTDGIQPDALYRPLTLWTYLANQWLTPDQPWSFHLVNVLLHALVTALLGMLVWRLLGDRTVALVAGILFAVHPLHTEVVANTVGRAEMLAALWTLLALLIYLPEKPLMEERGPTTRPWWHGLLVAACFGAGMLSKESPATLIPMLFLLDCWRWARWRAEVRRAGASGGAGLVRWFMGQTLRYYLPLMLVFAGYLAARMQACGLMSDAGSVHPIVNLLVKATPMERVVTPFGLLARYMALTFWPVHLSADYSAPSIVPTTHVLQPFVAAGILLCVLGPLMAVRLWRKLPQIALLLLMFACSYFLVSNVIRIGTIFGERLFYWPGAFVLMLVAWGGVSLYRQAAVRRLMPARVIAALLLVALTAGMTVRTWIRNTDWSDNLPLAVATGRDNPGSAKACYWAATVLLWTDKPEYVEFGKTLLDRAAELYPDFASAQWEIAKYYGRKNDLGPSLLHLARAVRLDPGTHMTRLALSGILLDLKHAEPGRYMPAIEAEQKAHPNDAAVDFAFAVAMHAQGKYDDAETYAIKALFAPTQRPDGRDQFHEAAAELALIRFDRGRISEGVDMFRQYVMRVTRSVDARCDMAQMLLALDPHDYPHAIGEAEMNLDKAAALDATNPRLRIVRAEVLHKRQELRASASALPHDDVIGPSPEGPMAR